MSPRNRLAAPIPLPGAGLGALALEKVGDRPFDYGTEALVPLTRDWLVLLHAARRFERLSVQVRNACARLVASTPMPRFERSAGSSWFCDEGRALFLNFDFWLRAWAVARKCGCCGSPGRVMAHNARGFEFMQWCAPADAGIDRWADYVAAVALPLERRPPIQTLRDPRLPSLPATARIVASDAMKLGPLLATLGESGVRIRATVRATAATHTRELSLETGRLEHDVWFVSSGGVTLQFASRAIAALAVERRQTGPCLHGLDRAGQALLTLSAAANAADADAWRAAVEGMLSAQN